MKRRNPAKKSSKRAAKRRASTEKRAAKDAASTAPARAPRAARAEKPRDPRLPEPGTKITRAFKGKTLTLTLLADGGFELDGERFGSISGAAKKASGAKTVDGFSWWRLNPADAAKPPRERDPRCPAIGTTHERVYKGKTLKLKALEDGTFEFDGKVYASVSGAAKDACGARTVDGFSWWKLGTAAAKPGKATKGPKIGGEGNDIGTDAGQRAALAAAGIGKRKARKGAAAKRTTNATGEAK